MPRRRNRPRFACSGGCGRKVWREHTFCSPRCQRLALPSLLDTPAAEEAVVLSQLTTLPGVTFEDMFR